MRILVFVVGESTDRRRFERVQFGQDTRDVDDLEDPEGSGRLTSIEEGVTHHLPIPLNVLGVLRPEEEVPEKDVEPIQVDLITLWSKLGPGPHDLRRGTIGDENFMGPLSQLGEIVVTLDNTNLFPSWSEPFPGPGMTGRDLEPGVLIEETDEVVLIG